MTTRAFGMVVAGMSLGLATVGCQTGRHLERDDGGTDQDVGTGGGPAFDAGTDAPQPSHGAGGAGAAGQQGTGGSPGSGGMGSTGGAIGTGGAPAPVGTGGQPPPPRAVSFLAHVDYPVPACTVCGDLAIGDLNGDGKLDLALADLASDPTKGGVNVLFNSGAGALAPPVYHATGGAYSVAIGDFDRNGKLDLAVQSATGIGVLINSGNGMFAPVVDNAVIPGAIRGVADLDGDSWPDLAVTGFTSIAVAINNGNGTFSRGASYQLSGSVASGALGDVDGDARPDLVLTFIGTVGVFINNGRGTFAPVVNYPIVGSAQAIAIADLNGDGKADLAVTNVDPNVQTPDPTLSVFLNTGSGTFAPAVSYSTGTLGVSIAVGDLNGDGRLDIALADDTNPMVMVLPNAGSGVFASAVTYVTGPRSRTFATQTVAIGDLSGDGKPDLAIGLISGVSVLVNTTPW